MKKLLWFQAVALSAAFVGPGSAFAQSSVQSAAAAATNAQAVADAQAADAAKASAEASADVSAEVEASAQGPDAARTVERVERRVDATADRTVDRAATAKQRTEVLLRGPVHEAFARPMVGDVIRGEIAPKVPPRPIREIAPAAEDGAQFIEGYWSFDQATDGFVWVTGTLRHAPEGAVWVAGEWRQTAEGYVRAPGYWKLAENAKNAVAKKADDVRVAAHKVETATGMVDVPELVDRPLSQRGVLYAPIRIADAAEARAEATNDRAREVADRGVDRAEAAVENRRDAVVDRAQNVRERAGAAGERIADAANARVDATQDRANDVANAATNSANARIDSAVESAENVQDRASAKVDAANDAAEMKLEDASEAVADARQNAENAATATVERTTDQAAALKRDARELAADGKDAARTTANDARSQAYAAVDSAKDLANDVDAQAAAEAAANAQAGIAATSDQLSADATSSILADADGTLRLQPVERISADSLMMHLFVNPTTDAFHFGDYYGDEGQALGLVHWSASELTQNSLLSQYDELHRGSGDSFVGRLAGWNRFFESNAVQRPARTLAEAREALGRSDAAVHRLSHLSHSIAERASDVPANATSRLGNVNADVSATGGVNANVSAGDAGARTLQSLNAELGVGGAPSPLRGAANLNGAVNQSLNGAGVGGALNGAGAFNGSGGLGGIGGAAGGALGK